MCNSFSGGVVSVLLISSWWVLSFGLMDVLGEHGTGTGWVQQRAVHAAAGALAMRVSRGSCFMVVPVH